MSGNYNNIKFGRLCLELIHLHVAVMKLWENLFRREISSKIVLERREPMWNNKFSHKLGKAF